MPRPSPAFLMIVCACVHAKTLQSCQTFCDPMDSSLPGSSVHGILQIRMLEWVATPIFGGSSRPRMEPVSYLSCIWQVSSLPPVPPGKSLLMTVAQLCLTCDPMICRPQGFSVHGILQARILEWIAIPFSRGFS